MLCITHPGQAHRDEFVAICLLISAGIVDRVERREPTPEELDDPKVVVIDIGGRHEPELMNFDHHQLPRDAAAVCSITLVLGHLGLLDNAREAFQWLRFSEVLDSKGPFAAALESGMTPDALQVTMSPIEATVLQWFESLRTIESTTVDPGFGEHEDPLWVLMRRLGDEKRGYVADMDARLQRLREVAVVRFLGGVQVLDATAIPAVDKPVFGLEALCRQLYLTAAVTVTQDDRGAGLCLFRRNDDPRVDFSQLEGRTGVVFAHKGGFVAKLEVGVDPWPMIEAALVEVEAAA